MGTDYQGNCTPGTNQKIFLKKSVPVVQMEKISQFLPKNGPKMAKYLQKKFCTPGTPNILGKKKLYPGYTKKIGAKKSVPRVHQKNLGQKICTPGTNFKRIGQIKGTVQFVYMKVFEIYIDILYSSNMLFLSSVVSLL